MKILVSFFLAFSIAAASKSCGGGAKTSGCFKGRLEVAGICSNYTIKVLEGDPSGWTQASWTNEETGKKHTQVFRLANPCAFPDSLEEGDTFYFTLDTSKQEPCTVCMAFYPTPQKEAAIKVQRGPCK